MKMEITINGITKAYYCLDAEIRYRSHINGMQCTCPDSWVAMEVSPVDDPDLNYIAWYLNEEGKDLDDIDYSTPFDLEKIN